MSPKTIRVLGEAVPNPSSSSRHVAVRSRRGRRSRSSASARRLVASVRHLAPSNRACRPCASGSASLATLNDEPTCAGRRRGRPGCREALVVRATDLLTWSSWRCVRRIGSQRSGPCSFSRRTSCWLTFSGRGRRRSRLSAEGGGASDGERETPHDGRHDRRALMCPPELTACRGRSSRMGRTYATLRREATPLRRTRRRVSAARRRTSRR